MPYYSGVILLLLYYQSIKKKKRVCYSCCCCWSKSKFRSGVLGVVSSLMSYATRAINSKTRMHSQYARAHRGREIIGLRPPRTKKAHCCGWQLLPCLFLISSSNYYCCSDVVTTAAVSLLPRLRCCCWQQQLPLLLLLLLLLSPCCVHHVLVYCWVAFPAGC